MRSVRFAMNLHLHKNNNRVGFPGLRRARRGSGFLLATATLVFLNDNCGRSAQPENQQPKTMNTKAENLTAPNDPLSIQRRAIVVDMHADTTQRLVDENVDLEHRLADGHFDAVRAKEGGLDAQFFSIWVEPELFGGGGARAVKRADDQIRAVHALAAQHPETWELATTAADGRRIAAAGKIAAPVGMGGGYASGAKIEDV